MKKFIEFKYVLKMLIFLFLFDNFKNKIRIFQYISEFRNFAFKTHMIVVTMFEHQSFPT